MTVTLDGAPGAVQLTPQRRGKKSKLRTPSTQPPERLREGPTLVSVLLPRLSPGIYQLVATGPFTPRAARFTVRR